MTKSNELCKTYEYHRFLIILKLKTSCDCLKQYSFDLLIAISKENNKNVKAETRAHLSSFIQQGQKYFLRGKIIAISNFTRYFGFNASKFKYIFVWLYLHRNIENGIHT